MRRSTAYAPRQGICFTFTTGLLVLPITCCGYSQAPCVSWSPSACSLFGMCSVIHASPKPDNSTSTSLGVNSHISPTATPKKTAFSSCVAFQPPRGIAAHNSRVARTILVPLYTPPSRIHAQFGEIFDFGGILYPLPYSSQ